MITLLGDRVLVVLPPKDEAEAQDAATGYTYRDKGEASGLVLATPTDQWDRETETRGIVVQTGSYYACPECGSRRDTTEFSVGDCVLFKSTAGDLVVLDGLRHVILREEDILAVIEPFATEHEAA